MLATALRLRAWPLRAALLFALWLLLVGSLQRLELVAGAVATAFGLAGIAAARRHLPAYRLEPRLLRSLPRLPWELARDTAVVLAALPLRRRGRFRSTALPTAQTPAGRGRRAYAEVRGSVAPNAIVVDVDPELGAALLHELDTRVRGDPL